MTNHWIDLKNANVLLVMGSNVVENHPIASRWIWTAKEQNNATIIHVDPRFTRTSAKADMYAPIRSGTDITFLGGMIRWMINKWETLGTHINQKYVEDCTNALFLVNAGFQTCRDAGHPGTFSGSATWDYQYGPDYNPFTTWAASTAYTTSSLVVQPTIPNARHYLCTVAGTSGATEPVWPTTENSTVVDGTVTWKCVMPAPQIKKPLKATLPTGPGTGLNDPQCVFQKLKEQYSAYTPQMVEKICGTPQALFEQICEAYCGGTYADDKAGTMLYAMGWTQHTVGTQNIRTATIIQSLLGNIGVAGGGIDALRGWHNVQGATDHALLQHYLPGYLGAPTNVAGNAQLGTGPLDLAATYLKGAVPIAMDPDAPAGPQSSNWWGRFGTQYNRARYAVSLLKAWWPTVDHNDSWSYIPKKHTDCTYLSLIKAINDGIIKGLFAWGTNPMVMGPDQNYERNAMDNLEWLVCCDLFETETASFWKRPGLTPAQIAAIPTEVYLLPGACFAEKEGSASNSGRLMQWRDTACPPPGDAKDELEIVNDLGAAIRSAYGFSGPPPTPPSPYTPVTNDALKYLAWPVGPLLTTGTLAEKVAKEVNGYALVAYTSNFGTIAYAQGQQIANFFHLNSGGESACGNWLFCGTYQASGNQMRNRTAVDYHPAQIGIYHLWGYSWPVNRRIIYNRASVYNTIGPSGQAVGTPLNPTKWVVWFDGVNRGGSMWHGGCPDYPTHANDVVDGFGVAGPTTWLPYIMNAEGVAKLMGGKGLLEGPFPEHYEPKETPLMANILTNGAGPLTNPQAYAYPGATYAAPGDPDYPIIATTYRCTEHWHGGGCTRNCPTQCELMPEPFVEMSEELAAAKGISNGDLVIVSSARGSITLKACVTKRWKPFVIDGVTRHEVGMLWHWGFAGLCSGESANMLTPYIGDANTRIPETKVFLVDIAKA